ncbi:MAG: hypothetical protein LBQ77_03440 [Treponema sp.]|jgi:outer membrane protein assembly factor BamD (BamD/ComL family)|nr:hypothetical protein [Treponema sp.]
MRILIIIGIFLSLYSCASKGSIVVEADMSPAQIIQHGQEAFDQNRYDQALQYYEALETRFSNNPALALTAQYEKAFIHYKMKQYTVAAYECELILARYNEPDASILPAQYKKLASIVLGQIKNKTS